MSDQKTLDEAIKISNDTNDVLSDIIRRNNDILELATVTSSKLKAETEVFRSIDNVITKSSNNLPKNKKSNKCLIM